jgi:hypothetical protein
MAPILMECPAAGKKLRNDRDAVELIGEALHAGAGIVAIPVERFDADFFRLRTCIAGEFIQKFVTYGVPLAIVGDISAHLAESSALRDFVCEANRGQHVWFLASREELDRRLLTAG